jgi:tetratricopeptide (TPR) repeat protein
VQLNLSRIYLDQIDYENAIPHLVEVARLQPSARRYANLGDVYRKSGQLENAINAFQKAIRKDPEDAFSHLGLGLSYAAYGNFEQARSELEKVIELSPNSSYASRAKDWLKANENKFK